MKIKRGDIYYIELYLEPGKISDHNKRSNGTLSFTGVELMDAIEDELQVNADMTFDLIGNLETLDYKIADSKEIIASYER